MMKAENENWIQRFSHFKKALTKLEDGVAIRNRTVANHIFESENLDEIVREAIIRRFVNTHELAWKLMKAYLEYQGVFNLMGSANATREAFAAGLIEDGELWMDMIKSRNLSSHTYDEANAQGLFEEILNAYLPAFQALKAKMESLR
ncbi:MAG: nucleotidyltransferase substrate binding protein [Balneolales bacterium]|nr:nucleotidyltransferase substrate binding protein [Balneolales bacterium]